MRSSLDCGLDLAKWLERLTANAPVATVQGSIPASVDTVDSEGRQMKQCWIQYEKKIKKSLQKIFEKKEKELRVLSPNFHIHVSDEWWAIYILPRSVHLYCPAAE